MTSIPAFAWPTFLLDLREEREHGPRRPNGEHPRRSRQAPKGSRP